MNRMIQTVLAVIGGAVMILCFVCVSSAELPVSDVKEINQYKLTDQKLTQFFQATKNLAPIIQKAPPTADDSDDEDDDGENLTKLVQQFDAIPGAQKAVQDAGMNTREYLTFQFALVYAASGQLILKNDAKLPAEYSKQNIDFFTAHEAEFKKHQDDFEAVRRFSKDELEDDEDSEEDSDDR